MGSIQGLQAFERRVNAITPATGPVDERMKRHWQIETVANAKRLVHRKTGNLGRSIHPGPITEHGASVEVSAAYAADVEFGTRPHDIVPVHAKVLAWGGARRLTGALRSGARPEFFAKIVHHPGNQPYPFLRPGAQKALEDGGMVNQFIISWNEAA